MNVLGVDCCRAGWLGAVLADDELEVVVAADVRSLLEGAGAVEVVGVDMPIGLPDSGPRQADLLARALLPRERKSSVFPAPTRAACAEVTHAEASAANRLATGGTGISIQAFGLVPKILEVDELVRSRPAYAVIEVHPDLSFATLDPDVVTGSKKTAEGQAARAGALRAQGARLPPLVRGRGYGVDDLLDACVAAWTAAKYAAGGAESLPDPPERFRDGIDAAIWH
jgi:predicted RNase H-like nuclease